MARPPRVDQEPIFAAITALGRIEWRLNGIERAIRHLVDEQTIHDLTEEALMSDLSTVVTDLETRVGEMSDVEESAATLLGELGAKVTDLTTELQNAGVDPALVQRLTDLGTVISDEDGKLSQAVAKNTPADTTVGSDTGAPADSGADTSEPAVDADGNPV